MFLFMLIHSALLADTTFDLKNVLVNVMINIRLINALILFIISLLMYITNVNNET